MIASGGGVGGSRVCAGAGACACGRVARVCRVARACGRESVRRGGRGAGRARPVSSCLGLSRPVSARLGSARLGSARQGSHPAGERVRLSPVFMRGESLTIFYVNACPSALTTGGRAGIVPRMAYSGPHHKLRTSESWAEAFDSPWPAISCDSTPLAPVSSFLVPTQGEYVLQQDSNGNRIVCRWDRGERSGYRIVGYSDSWSYASEWRGY